MKKWITDDDTQIIRWNDFEIISSMLEKNSGMNLTVQLLSYLTGETPKTIMDRNLTQTDLEYINGIVNVPKFEQYYEQFTFNDTKWYFTINPWHLEVGQYADLEMMINNYEGNEQLLNVACILLHKDDEKEYNTSRLERMDEIKNLPAAYLIANCTFFLSFYKSCGRDFHQYMHSRMMDIQTSTELLMFSMRNIRACYNSFISWVKMIYKKLTT